MLRIYPPGHCNGIQFQGKTGCLCCGRCCLQLTFSCRALQEALAFLSPLPFWIPMPTTDGCQDINGHVSPTRSRLKGQSPSPNPLRSQLRLQLGFCPFSFPSPSCCKCWSQDMTSSCETSGQSSWGTQHVTTMNMTALCISPSPRGNYSKPTRSFYKFTHYFWRTWKHV